MLVLAGGFGSRLQSFVPEVPKALAPICGKPFLYHQIMNWKAQGIKSFVFLLYHQANLIIDFLEAMKDAVLSDCTVEWVVEPSPMDTGGAILNAIMELDIKDDFLVTNADTWIKADIKELLISKPPSLAVVHKADCSRYGKVLFNEKAKITKFVEKNENAGGGWVNAGLYHLDASLFNKMKNHKFSVERDFFPTLVNQEALSAIELNGEFIDIGVPDDYLYFNAWFASHVLEEQ